MSDTQPSQAPGSQTSSRGGGRRRGRGGGAYQIGQAQATQQTGGGGSGRGSRSRGHAPRRGGGRDKQNRSANKPEETTEEKSGPATGEQAVAGETGGDEGKGKKAIVTATDDADDGEICFICASNVEHTSVSPCNHRTCHICALRLRALYKNKACAHCRVRDSFYDADLEGPQMLTDARPRPTMSSSRIIMRSGLKSSLRTISLARMITWASNTKMTTSLRTRSCCCATTVPRGIAMWLA